MWSVPTSIKNNGADQSTAFHSPGLDSRDGLKRPLRIIASAKSNEETWYVPWLMRVLSSSSLESS